jgi:hypothetical protein
MSTLFGSERPTCIPLYIRSPQSGVARRAFPAFELALPQAKLSDRLSRCRCSPSVTRRWEGSLSSVRSSRALGASRAEFLIFDMCGL